MDTADFRRRPPEDRRDAGNVGASRAVSSVVEHYLDTVGVRGSKPLPRTIFIGTGWQS